MGHTFVKDVMIKDVISLDETSSVMEAAQMMKDANVGCVIVTKNNNPVGIVTERDFVIRIAAEEKSLSSPLSTVMSSPITVIDPDSTVWEAAEIMKTHRIHKVPVKEGNQVVGIVTATDLVKICSVGSDSSMRKIVDDIIMRMQDEKPTKIQS